MTARPATGHERTRSHLSGTTKPTRLGTDSQHETLPKQRPQTPTQPRMLSEDELQSPHAPPGHQRFVLTDHIAFRYLEEDPDTTVLERRKELRGYECYIVEQWTTSRTHPTFAITTYTGDSSHVVVVGVLSVPTDESTWSPRLRVYFKALNQYHARRRDTPLGIMMVTNLAGFPSSLTVIGVPDGDLRKHRFDYFVNEDLKRLGCSGRSGLALVQPAPATVAKFVQLYKTSDKNDIYQSVIELVKLCQSALMLFSKLGIDYADGLLCDVTERAIGDWWADIGTEHYNTEPHDGILGPTTVAGLLGMLLGARNRLQAAGAPVTKDPFDVEGMKRGISAFQKSQRLDRTRRLDRITLDRLHKLTQKAADKERWAVPRAVKSTVAELSGKGGEMMMDAVGRRDRAGIAEVETTDIDRFVQLLYGDRSKWLWLGKPIKKSRGGGNPERAPQEAREPPSLGKGLIFKHDQHGGYQWAEGRKSIIDGVPGNKQNREQQYDVSDPSAAAQVDDESDENGARASVLKRASALRHEAKHGLGKVKGAVGLGGHKSKPPPDEDAPVSPVEQIKREDKRPLMRRALSSPVSSPNSDAGRTKEREQDHAATVQSDRLNAALSTRGKDDADTRSMVRGAVTSRETLPHFAFPRENKGSAESSDQDHLEQRNRLQSETVTAEPSIAGSVYNGVDLNDALPTGPETEVDVNVLLRRSVSYSQYVKAQIESPSGDTLPRHLSFSLAEESVLNWPSLAEASASDGDEDYADLLSQYAEQEFRAREAKSLRSLISSLDAETVPWTQHQLNSLEAILKQADQDQETLDSIHRPHEESMQGIEAHADGVLRQWKESLDEGAKEIETLGSRLEYEINELKSKVEDVEAGVVEFEKGVTRVEDRVLELEREGGKNSIWGCIMS